MMLPRLAAASPGVEYRPWRPAVWPLLVIAAVLCGGIIGAMFTAGIRPFPLDRFDGPLDRYEYHLWRWEANTVLDNAFAQLGIGPEPSQAEGERAVREYFKLTSQIAAASDSAQPDTRLIEALGNERASYASDVQRLIEGYIDEAVDSVGLERRLPLFSGVSITWPPVDFKLTSPPRLLVRSPRSKIVRSGDTLLEPGLSLADAEKIEARTDSRDMVSLVISIGGIAAYPAIVRDDRSYDSLLETASHEWTHHYLAFFPLGQQWGNGGDAETLNETTANISGREIANLIRKAHPLTLPTGEDGSAPARPAPSVDFSKEMHDLRLQVDDLLAHGQVTEAEQAMEARRQFFAERGINIRKINQAYFAFYGTYGDSAASSNPVGPKIEHVWELTKDVGLFLANMREVKNVRDLDRTIARLEAAR